MTIDRYFANARQIGFARRFTCGADRPHERRRTGQRPGPVRRSRRRCAGNVFMAGGLWLCLLPVLAGAAGGQIEYRFLWDQGNAIMASAETPEAFLRASETYRQLLREGARNGPLLYNYGTALLQAQHYEHATAALLRAERYLGTTPDIRKNLVLSAAAGSEIQPSLAWYRLLLFWHYGLPGTTRITVVAAAFSLFWIALCIRTLGFSATARHAMILSMLVLMLFGSSIAVTVHSEARDHDQLLTRDAQPGLLREND